MLSEDFTAVSASRDSEELFVAVLQFCRRLEFDTMTAMAVLDHPDRETEFRCVDNAPPGYLDMANDPAEGRRDPVMQHCRFSSSSPLSGIKIRTSQPTALTSGKVRPDTGIERAWRLRCICPRGSTCSWASIATKPCLATRRESPGSWPTCSCLQCWRARLRFGCCTRSEATLRISRP